MSYADFARCFNLIEVGCATAHTVHALSPQQDHMPSARTPIVTPIACSALSVLTDGAAHLHCDALQVCCKTMPTARAQFDGTPTVTTSTTELRATLADEAPVCHSPRTLIGMLSLATPAAATGTDAAAGGGDAAVVGTEATLELTVGDGATRFGQLSHAHTASDASRRVCTLSLGSLHAKSTLHVLYELNVPSAHAVPSLARHAVPSTR
jgi:hypothetical protein